MLLRLGGSVDENSLATGLTLRLSGGSRYGDSLESGTDKAAAFSLRPINYVDSLSVQNNVSFNDKHKNDQHHIVKFCFTSISKQCNHSSNVHKCHNNQTGNDNKYAIKGKVLPYSLPLIPVNRQSARK